MVLQGLGLAIAVVTFAAGGWSWGAVAVLVLWRQRASGATVRELLVTFGPPLLWLATFVVTGDRRLFFPYSIYLAAALGLAPGAVRSFWREALLVIALFSAVRLLQSAPLLVLLIELLVAAVALWPARRWASSSSSRWPSVAWTAAAVASLLAYAGLAVN